MDPLKRKKYRLLLDKLEFVSVVDRPAQETATVRLVKRDTLQPEHQIQARVVKTDDELGLVFCWAITSKVDGVEYFDLQGDNVEEADLIKVAAAFMEAGGASDTMHDENATGRVLFAMPWTPEVAKGFLGPDFEATTTGLMVAIKPHPDVFAKVKNGTYNGVSIGGHGFRRELAEKGVEKKMALTSKAAGHTHTIHYTEESQGGYTGWTDDHDHPFVIGADGEITIGAAMGHTHRLAQVSKSDEPTDYGEETMKDAKQLAEELSKAQAEIETLKARAEKAERLASMTAAERRHYAALAPVDQSAFLAKSADERAAVVAKDAELDEVVYTTRSGIQLTKRDEQRDPTRVALAKENDTMAAELETSRLEKRAEAEIPALPATAQVRVALLKAVDAIEDEEVRKEAHRVLGAASTALSKGMETLGARREALTKSGQDFEAKVSEIMKRDSVSKASAMSRAASEFPEEFAAYQGVS